MHIPRRLQKGQGGTPGPQGGTDPITSLELGSSVHTPPGPPWVNVVLPRGQGRTQCPQRCEAVRTLRHPTGNGGGGRPPPSGCTREPPGSECRLGAPSQRL